jgi:hypothetical protein
LNIRESLATHIEADEFRAPVRVLSRVANATDDFIFVISDPVRDSVSDLTSLI